MIADLTPPTIVSVVNSSISNLLVTYSEPVREGNVPGHYTLSNGATISAATNSADTRQVVLTTSLLTLKTPYTLTINGVYDRAANANTIAPDTRVAFVAAELGSLVIGQVPAPASFQPVGGGFHLSMTGGEVGAYGDQFQFNAMQRAGDFDYRVRVQSLTLNDPWAKAGLMARDGLRTNSVFAAVFATPNIGGCYFESREATNALTTKQGSFPVNYPYTWLRLQRAGELFTGYASFDGEAWVALGSANLVITNTFYMGVAFAGHATNQVTVAEVRDFGGVTGEPRTGYLPERYESLAASSRRTPMVISEIMYHPWPQADGKDLEYVELFNSSSVPYDLGGFHLAGDIQYDFPSGTLLGPGSFLVVAHTPADVQGRYQIGNVLGGYQGRLSNQAGAVQLLHRSGAVFLDVAYASAPPWPASADGAGHSLVLARPSFGEGSPAAWAASARVGGSPGAAEIFVNDAWRTVMINEVLAAAVPPDEDYVELYNHSTNTVVLEGCGLSDDPATNKFVFAKGGRDIAARLSGSEAFPAGLRPEFGGRNGLFHQPAARPGDRRRAFRRQPGGSRAGPVSGREPGVAAAQRAHAQRREPGAPALGRGDQRNHVPPDQRQCRGHICRTL